MEPATSVGATAFTSSRELFAPVTENSGKNSGSSQVMFPSHLKAEPHADNHGPGTAFSSQFSDSKETNIFGKIPFSAFSGTSGITERDMNPFQVKIIGTQYLPSAVAATSSDQAFLNLPVSSTASSLFPVQSSVVAMDSATSPFPSSSMFSLPRENVSSLFQPSMTTFNKVENSKFSFSETFKEAKDKSTVTEAQLDKKGTGVLGKLPAFSFTSVAANIIPGTSTVDYNISVGDVSEIPSSGSTSKVQDREQCGSRIVFESPREMSASTSRSRPSAEKVVSPLERRTKHKRDCPKIKSSRKKSKDDERKPHNKSSKLMSPEELNQITSVVCKGIHPNLNNKTTILKHFSKFGEVKRVCCSPKNDQAVITYLTHEAAEDAKKLGGAISLEHKPAEVFWGKVTKPIDSKKLYLGSEVDEELQSMMEFVDHPVLRRPLELAPPKLKVVSSRKNEILKSDTKKCDSRKSDARKNDVSKSDAKKSDVSKSDTKKSDVSKLDTKKSDVPKSVTRKSDVSKSGEKKNSVSKYDTKKSDLSKSDVKKRSSASKPDLKDSKHSDKSAKYSKTVDCTDESLRKLLEMQTRTEENRYHVLDARDKLMRLSVQKQSDISKAKAIAGTCSDMCSEKERYSRFEKNRLSAYERKKTFDPKITSKCLDHKLIVKEYSRSSADKEEPLPHEIRPTSVLNLTMDHIMCNIANRTADSTVSVRDWYDFIWNRTRAIRKDITQQDLCDIDCVKLVEKCVRFHIHCAAVLCDEDMAAFDPKINDENLTKSLQTLKHMYHDLRLSGIKCCNEAEFRAYDILLSLNEGDTLRQAQNFSSEIRSSPEVQFSVASAFALNSNNYIRFFNLVEEASYLNACIMHRYFTQVRTRALKVILKAYCLPNHIEQYPLEELVETLKFESVAEAVQFCQWLGFHTDEDYVQLDRMSIIMPSSTTLVWRSVNLVENKRRVPVGEVMNKDPLPVNPMLSYEPHNSFDSDGYLKKEAYDASDQNQKVSDQQCDAIKIVVQHKPSAATEFERVVKSVKCSTQKNDDISISDFIKLKPPSVSPDFNDSSSQRSLTGTVMKWEVSEQSESKGFKPLFDEKADGIFPLPSFDEKEDSSVIEEHIVGGSASIAVEENQFVHYAPDVVEEILLEVLENYIREFATREVMISSQKVALSMELADSMVNYAVDDLCLDVVCDVVREVTLAELDAYEMQEQKERCAISFSDEIILDTLHGSLFDIAESEYLEAKAKTKILDTACKSEMKSLLGNCVDDLVVSVVEEIYCKEMDNWHDSVQTARRKTQLQQARKALVKWQRVYTERRKLEINRNTFPCGPQIPLKACALDADFESVLFRMKKEKELSKLLDAGVLYSSIRQEFSWLPVNLSVMFEKYFPKLEPSLSPSPKTVCWKLLLLMPESCSGEVDDEWITFVHWLCSKFCRKKCESIFQNGMILCDLFSKTENGCHVDICVRAVLLGSKDFHKNLSIVKKEKFLEGTSAIFLLMPLHKMDDEIVDEILIDVQQMLHGKCPVPPVPLYCFLVGSKVSEIPPRVNQFLNALKSCHYLSEYEISIIDNASHYWKSSEKLLEAIAWLLKQYNEIPHLMSCCLRDFVEDCFLKIFNVVYEDLSHITNLSEGQNPSKIIAFCNSAFDDYTEAVCSPALSKISWPPPEIISSKYTSGVIAGWNEPAYLNKIRGIMGNIQLPEFQGSSVILNDMWSYIEKIANLGNSNDCSFYSSIKSILAKTLQPVSKGDFIPWSDILYSCVHYLISCQCFIDESVEKELQVTYIFEDLECLDLKSKWKSIAKENELSLNDRSTISKKRKHPSSELDEISGPRDLHFTDSFENQNYITMDHEIREATYSPPYVKKVHLTEFPVRNLAKCAIEESSSFLEVLAAERSQNESYLSLLETKVAEGQWVNDDALSETFAEENDDEEDVSCSPQECDERPDDISVKYFVGVCSGSVNIRKSLEALEVNLAAQQEANRLFEKRLKEFM